MCVKILHLDEVDSTNSYALRNYDTLADGTLVISSTQHAGRGRRGRVWQSPAGVNIYGTLVMKSLSEPFLAGAMLGLAVLETLREFVPEAKSFLKWPNDVYVYDRKIAGILCESAGIANGKIIGLVAGVGLNVNLSFEELNMIDQPATSLKNETNIHFDVKKVALRLEKSLNRYYITKNSFSVLNSVFEDWKRENRLIGHEIELVSGSGERFIGVFTDIREDGELVLNCNGELRSFNCGDVKINRNRIDWNKL